MPILSFNKNILWEITSGSDRIINLVVSQLVWAEDVAELL